MHVPSYILPLGVALLAPTVNAWTWTYDDSNGETHVATGEDEQTCSTMDMTEGNEYHWDPETDTAPLCISLFADNECQDRNGYSCEEWGPRPLGQPTVGSWLVSSDPDSGGDPVPSGSQTGSHPTGSRTGSMPMPTGSHGSGSSSMSMTSGLPTSSAPLPTSTATETETDDDDSNPTETAPPAESTSAGGSASTVAGRSMAEVMVGVVAGLALGFY